MTKTSSDIDTLVNTWRRIAGTEEMYKQEAEIKREVRRLWKECNNLNAKQLRSLLIINQAVLAVNLHCLADNMYEI